MLRKCIALLRSPLFPKTYRYNAQLKKKKDVLQSNLWVASFINDFMYIYVQGNSFPVSDWNYPNKKRKRSFFFFACTKVLERRLLLISYIREICSRYFIFNFYECRPSSKISSFQFFIYSLCAIKSELLFFSSFFNFSSERQKSTSFIFYYCYFRILVTV